MQDIHPKLILNSNLVKSHSPITHLSVFQSFWNFAQSTAVSLLCSVQNFEMIVQLEQLLWTNEISRDWSSRWVLDRFPILLKAPDLHTDCALCSEWENKMFSCMFNDIEGLAQDCSNSSVLAMELLQSCAEPMLSSTRAASRFAPSQWEMSLQSNILSHWLGANLESALFYSSNPSQSDRPWCEDQHTHMHHVICQQRKNVTFQLDWDSTGQHSMSWTLWYHPFLSLLQLLLFNVLYTILKFLHSLSLSKSYGHTWPTVLPRLVSYKQYEKISKCSH